MTVSNRGNVCVDPSRLTLAIFGAIFGTLLLCTGFALAVWYLVRNHQFADKLLFPEAAGRYSRRKRRKKSGEANVEEPQPPPPPALLSSSSIAAAAAAAQQQKQQQQQQQTKPPQKTTTAAVVVVSADCSTKTTTKANCNKTGFVTLEMDEIGHKSRAGEEEGEREEEEEKASTSQRSSQIYGTKEELQKQLAAEEEDSISKTNFWSSSTEKGMMNGKTMNGRIVEERDANQKCDEIDEKLVKEQASEALHNGNSVVKKDDNCHTETISANDDQMGAKKATISETTQMPKAEGEEKQITPKNSEVNGQVKKTRNGSGEEKRPSPPPEKEEKKEGVSKIIEEEQQQQISSPELSERLRTMLSSEQFDLLEANRQRLEQERRQLRKLGVIF